MSIRTAFLGTPAAAVPALRALSAIAEVSVVICQPDRVRGRGRGAAQPPPVKEAALALGLRVAQPTGAVELLAALGPDLDVAVVVAYGRLIRPEALTTPRRGFVNVHFSLLPRWRGASPVVRTILAGDEQTGVTLMQMDEGLDTGPVLAVAETSVQRTETAGELTGRLADMGASLLAEHLDDVVAGRLVPTPQPDAGATAAGKVTTGEAFVDPARHSLVAVDRAVRAFNPKPGAWGTVDGERCKLWTVGPAAGPSAPGVAAMIDGAAVLGCRDGALELIEVQPAGAGRMSGAAWLNGRRGEPALFDSPTGS